VNRRLAAVLAAAFVLAACSQAPVAAGTPAGPQPGTYTGRLGTAAYVVDIPAHWNHTLLLYSHGYAAPGSGNPATDGGYDTTRGWLLGQGYALAGSAYSGTGWAPADAFTDQVALLGAFATRFGKPARTIAWGYSLGGLITAGLIQLHPELFSGALAMCGVLGGGIGNWNGALDIGFATQVLLDPKLQLVHIQDPGGNLDRAQADLTTARATPQGRARIALIAALGNLPGWFSPLEPEPEPTDYANRVLNQASWLGFDSSYVFAYRAELEQRAGGNPSWNTGVDYGRAFAASPGRAEAETLYQQAGLDLGADLARIQAAPRIAADPAAVSYLNQNLSFNGKLVVPEVTMHTTGDGLVVVGNEAAYADVVASSSSSGQLRQLFVHRANHCVFTPAEQIAAFQVLFDRLDKGAWDPVTADAMNARAAALGGKYNGGRLPGATTLLSAPPQFLDFSPPAFPREFDARNPLP